MTRDSPSGKNPDDLTNDTISSGANCLSNILVVVVYTVIACNVYMYFQHFLPILFVLDLSIFPFHNTQASLFGNLQAMLMTIMFVYIVFSIVFNYTLVMLVSPGKVSDYYEKVDPEYEIEYPPAISNASGELRQLLKLRGTKIGHLNNDWDRRCRKCFLTDYEDDEQFEDYPIKPLRFHHCSICK